MQNRFSENGESNLRQGAKRDRHYLPGSRLIGCSKAKTSGLSFKTKVSLSTWVHVFSRGLWQIPTTKDGQQPGQPIGFQLSVLKAQNKVERNKPDLSRRRDLSNTYSNRTSLAQTQRSKTRKYFDPYPDSVQWQYVNEAWQCENTSQQNHPSEKLDNLNNWRQHLLGPLRFL